MTTMPEQPCAHPGCGCKVEQSGQFCSNHCRQHDTTPTGHDCQCGHSDCVVEQALRRADQHGSA